MANFLTDGRVALRTAIEADAAINPLVKKWYAFKGGLLQPYEIVPADCPVYALYPGPIVEPELRKEIAYDIEQRIAIQITTEGDDPEPCENLVALTLDRCRLARADMLGLSGDGLANIVPTVAMQAWRNEEEKWLMWQATVTVGLRWIRRRFA